MSRARTEIKYWLPNLARQPVPKGDIPDRESDPTAFAKYVETLSYNEIGYESLDQLKEVIRNRFTSEKITTIYTSISRYEAFFTQTYHKLLKSDQLKTGMIQIIQAVEARLPVNSHAKTLFPNDTYTNLAQAVQWTMVRSLEAAAPPKSEVAEAQFQFPPNGYASMDQLVTAITDNHPEAGYRKGSYQWSDSKDEVLRNIEKCQSKIQEQFLASTNKAYFISHIEKVCDASFTDFTRTGGLRSTIIATFKTYYSGQ